MKFTAVCLHPFQARPEIVLVDCAISLEQLLCSGGPWTQSGTDQLGLVKLTICSREGAGAETVVWRRRPRIWVAPYNRELFLYCWRLRKQRPCWLDFFAGFTVNDETWGAICDSFQAHPTLEVLILPRGGCYDGSSSKISKSRMYAIIGYDENEHVDTL
jgi:hypothetical protein